MTTSAFHSTEQPRYSPWGAIQTAKQIAPGIWHVTTASHGGLHLSPERLARVSPHWQTWAGYGLAGWFEEDCDWAIVAYTFPEAFDAGDLITALDMLEHGRPDQLAKVEADRKQPA